MVDLSSPVTIDICGVVMPISAFDGCDDAHWAEVYQLICDSVHEVGMKASMVSFSDEVSVIQKRIVQNSYENKIIVCDVSGRNPNVMFELGLRLAFDKPVVIIKDDKTASPFDTSIIEFLPYPRDLRFSKIVEFKKKLAEKIRSSLQAQADQNYSPFIKNFGDFKVVKLQEKEISQEQFLIDELKSMRDQLYVVFRRIMSIESIDQSTSSDIGGIQLSTRAITIKLEEKNMSKVRKFVAYANERYQSLSIEIDVNTTNILLHATGSRNEIALMRRELRENGMIAP